MKASSNEQYWDIINPINNGCCHCGIFFTNNDLTGVSNCSRIVPAKESFLPGPMHPSLHFS